MEYFMRIPRASQAIGLTIGLVLLTAPAAAAETPKSGSSLRITLTEAAMKSSPKPFGSKTIKTLAKGSLVTYLGSSGIYYKVSDKRHTGYIAARSVVEAGKFQSFSRSSKVSQSDMAAATKGFSPEVERENRKNKRLRYDRMDQAEQASTVADPASQLASFRKEGRLGEYGHE